MIECFFIIFVKHAQCCWFQLMTSLSRSWSKILTRSRREIDTLAHDGSFAFTSELMSLWSVYATCSHFSLAFVAYNGVLGHQHRRWVMIFVFSFTKDHLLTLKKLASLNRSLSYRLFILFVNSRKTCSVVSMWSQLSHEFGRIESTFKNILV